MVYKMILTVFTAVLLLSASALPVEDQPQQSQNVAQQNEPKPAEKRVDIAPQIASVEKQEQNGEQDLSIVPILPEGGAPAAAEEKSDLEGANTFWGGYYYRPYSSWGWRRGYGGGFGWGGYGSGYGYGRGYGGYGGWGGWGWGPRYYW